MGKRKFLYIDCFIEILFSYSKNQNYFKGILELIRYWWGEIQKAKLQQGLEYPRFQN